MKQFNAEKQSLRDLFSEEAPRIIIPDCKRVDGACRALWERVRALAGRECLLGAVVLCPKGPGRVEVVGGAEQLLASELFLRALCDETASENLSQVLEPTEEETPERRFFRDRLRELSASDADLPARMAEVVLDRAAFLVVEADTREEALRAASALGLSESRAALSVFFTEGRLAALTETAELAFPGPFGSRAWSPLDELLTQYLEARAVDEGESPLEEDGAPGRIEAFADFWKRVRTPVRRFPRDVLRWLLVLEQLPEAVWTRLLSAAQLARPGMNDNEFGRFLERAAAFAWLCAVRHPETGGFELAVRRGASALAHGRPDAQDFDAAELRRRIFAPAFTGGPAARSILAWWAFRREDQPLALPCTAFALARIGGEDKVGGGDRIGNLTLLEAPIAAAAERRSFAVKRGIWLGVAEDGFAHPKTIIRELEEIAQGGDLTRAQAERRGGAIRTALFDVLQKAFFVAEAPALKPEKAVPSPEQEKAFRARWAAVAASAAEAFPKTPAFGLCPPMEELLACFIYGELAMRGELKALPPGPKAFFGADPVGYFRKDEAALGRLEALADFWKRAAARDAGFSDAVKRRFFILGFAPNAVWTYLVSTYFLARRGKDGTLENEPLERFLQVVTAFVWGYSVVLPGADALKTAVLPEFAAIVRGRPVTFEGRWFLYNEVVSRFSAFDFGTNHPVRQAFLGWWAFRSENQPLPAPGTMFGVEHLGSGEALGNMSLLERSLMSTGPEAARPYMEKRRTWLGLSEGSYRTAVRELETLALAHEDFTDADVGARTQAIFNAFVEELGDAGIIRYWGKGQFEARWAEVSAALPGAMDQLLDGFLYGELARRGAIGPSAPRPKDLYGEAGARSFFRTRKAPLETLESLAAFWKRIRLLDEGFSLETRRWLSILSFAPNAVWTCLLSAWFLAGSSSRELPVRLLRALADFTLGWALEHSDEASLKEALLPEFSRVAAGRPLSFSDFRLDPERIRQSFASRRFTPDDPLTVPLLAWWTFRRAEQPLFGHRTEFKIERLTSSESPGIGGLSLIEKSINAGQRGERFAERRPYYLGFMSGKKVFQKTGVLELAEIAEAHEDFTPGDAAARTERIIEAFVAELGEVGLLAGSPETLWPEARPAPVQKAEVPDRGSPFGKRWTRIEAMAAKAFPKTPAFGLCPPMDELLACYVYGEAALRREVSEFPGLKAFLGENPARYFEGSEPALRTLEALADFWRRVEARDAGFSESVRRRLFILGFAPNAVWTYLLSAYFLANRAEDGSLENPPLRRFLRVITAFIWGASVVHPGADALKAAVLPEFSEIVSGRPVSFEGRRFSRGELLDSLASFDFTNHPVRQAILGWWAFRGEEQPIPAPGMAFAVEHFAPETDFPDRKAYESLGNTSLIERSRLSSGPYAVKRRRWLGTSVRDLDQAARTYETFTEADAGARTKTIVDAFVKEIEKNGLLEESPRRAQTEEGLEHTEEAAPEKAVQAVEDEGAWWSAFEQAFDADFPCVKGRATDMILAQYRVFECEKAGNPVGDPWNFGDFWSGRLEDGAVLAALSSLARFWERVRTRDPGLSEGILARLEVLRAVPDLDWMMPVGVRFLALRRADDSVDAGDFERFLRTLAAFLPAFALAHPDADTLRDGTLSATAFTDVRFSREAIGDAFRAFDFARREEVGKRLLALGDGMPGRLIDELDAVGLLEETSGSGEKTEESVLPQSAPSETPPQDETAWWSAFERAFEADFPCLEGRAVGMLLAQYRVFECKKAGDPWEVDDFYAGPNAWRLEDGEVLAALTSLAHFWERVRTRDPGLSEAVLRRLEVLRAVPDLDWMMPVGIRFLAVRRPDDSVDTEALGRFLRSLAAFLPAFALTHPEKDTLRDGTLPETTVFLAGGPEPFTTARFSREAFEGLDFEGRENVVKRILALDPAGRDRLCAVLLDELDAVGLLEASEEEAFARAKAAARLAEQECREAFERRWLALEKKGSGLLPTKELFTCAMYAELALAGEAIATEPNYRDFYREGTRQFFFEHEDALGRLERLARFWRRAADENEEEDEGFSESVRRRFAVLRFAPSILWKPAASVWAAANPEAADAALDSFLRTLTLYLWAAAIGHPDEALPGQVLPCLTRIAGGSSEPFPALSFDASDIRRRLWRFAFTEDSPETAAFAAWAVFRREDQPVPRPGTAFRPVQVRLGRQALRDPRTLTAIGNWTLLEPQINASTFARRFSEKESVAPSERTPVLKTFVRDLDRWAGTREDFSEEDIVERTRTIVDAFVGELVDAALAESEPEDEPDDSETEAEAPELSAGAQALLGDFMLCELAREGKSIEDADETDPRAFLEENPEAAGQIEALADFVGRLDAGGEGFSAALERQIRILSFAPEASRHLLLSAWFLSNRGLDEEGFGRFLRSASAFLLVLALRGSDEETERSAVLGVLPGIARGEEDAFSDSLLTHEDVRRRFAQLDFAAHESAARAFLAWWAFRDEAQPLFGPREEVRLERILPPEPDDWAAAPEGPGNFSLIEACIRTDAGGPRYAEKRRFYLGVRAGKRRTQGTKILELARIAKTHHDFTREDAGRRSQEMLSAFLAELAYVGLLPAEEGPAAAPDENFDEAFGLRWNRLVKTAAAAFPWLPAAGPGSALEVVLEGYMHHAAAKSGRTTVLPKARDFYRGGVRSFLRRNPQVFAAVEALADFWLRVRSRHKGFSQTVLKRLYVLNRVPDERWMIPLSVWFLAFRRADGTVPDAPLAAFLRTLAAFLCASAVVQSGDGVFAHSPFFAVLPDIAAGRPITFESFRFTRAGVRTAMVRQRFFNISPATRLLLAWWAMRREDQPLPGRSINIEHIYAKGFAALRPLVHRRNLEAIGNKSLLEHSLNDLAGSRSFAEKRAVYLGGKDSGGTVFLELRDLAAQKEDFTEKDIVERTQAIVGVFLGELDALGLLEADIESVRAFERRWTALEQTAGEGMEDLLDSLAVCELAKRGELGDRFPKFRDLHGGDPAIHFRGSPGALEAAEALAGFWKRVRARDAGFSGSVLRRLWILDWAPNAVWVPLLSAWFLAGRPLEEGFLRRMTAFIWAFSVAHPGADALKAALAPEITRIARGEEPQFTGACLTREELRARLVAFDFAGRPVRDSFAAWWAVSRPDQPLPPPGTELTVVRLHQRDRASGEAPGDRRTLESPGNAALAEKRDLPVRFADARRVWLGLGVAPKTVMRDLEEIAASHEDFTERDIVMRTARIVAAFLDEAAENGLFTEDARPAAEVRAPVEDARPAVEAPVEEGGFGEAETIRTTSPAVEQDAFTERWEAVERMAKDAFPPIPAFGGCLPMDELLACFRHYALGLSGEKKMADLFGGDPRAYFRGNESAFCDLEALARFWHRVRSQDEGFSDEVLRRFWVLGFAPNVQWTYLVSAWFFAHREGGTVDNGALGRFLRLVTDVFWSSAITNPRGSTRLKNTVRREIASIAAGRPADFSGMRLPPSWLRDRLESFDFSIEPVRFAFLAWWAMQREGQALPDGSVQMVLEDLYPEARDAEEPLEDEGSLGAIGNGVLLEAGVADAVPETDWRFPDLKRHWLEGSGTAVRELREIAQTHEDFTETDIRERSKAILEAFMAELDANGLLDAAVWAPGEFEEHWDALKAGTEALIPRTPAFGELSGLEAILEAWLPWELAVEGRLGGAAPKMSDLLGDTAPVEFFRGQRAMLETVESLAAFWKRVLTQDRGFSEGVLKCLFILSFAPNAVWTRLVSAWFLSRRDHAALENEPFERLLRTVAALTLGWSVLSDDAKAMMDAVLPDILRLSRGLPPVFEGCRLEPENLRIGLAFHAFEDGEPFTRMFLAWRAFSRPDQPLMRLRSELRVERILETGAHAYDSRPEGIGNKSLIEKSITTTGGWLEKRRRFLGFRLGKKIYQKTRIKDLEELAASHEVFTEKDAALRSAEILDAFMEELGALGLFVPAVVPVEIASKEEAPDAPGLFAGDEPGAEPESAPRRTAKPRRTRRRNAAGRRDWDLWQMADFDRRWCAVLEAADAAFRNSGSSALDELLGRFAEAEGLTDLSFGRDPREYFEDHEGALDRLEALAGLAQEPS